MTRMGRMRCLYLGGKRWLIWGGGGRTSGVCVCWCRRTGMLLMGLGRVLGLGRGSPSVSLGRGGLWKWWKWRRRRRRWRIGMRVCKCLGRGLGVVLGGVGLRGRGGILWLRGLCV